MPRIELIDPQLPLTQQSRDALRYPLRGAALPAIAAFTLAHYLALLPVAGWFLELVIWATTYMYALECLRHSADGYAVPPEFAEPGHGGWALVAILLRSMILTLLVKLNFGGGTWVVTLLMANHAAFQRAEALQLLDLQTSAWPDYRLYTDISIQRQRLASPA